MIQIITNKIKCNHCGDIIESKGRHDFVTCSCGVCSVDGGHDYLRRGFVYSEKDFTELSVTNEIADDDIDSEVDDEYDTHNKHHRKRNRR